MDLHFVILASLTISLWKLSNSNQGSLLKTKHLWHLLNTDFIQGDMEVGVGTTAMESFSGGERLNSTLDTELANGNFRQTGGNYYENMEVRGDSS